MILIKFFFVLSAFLITLSLYRVPVGSVHPTFSNLMVFTGVFLGAVAIIYRGGFRIRRSLSRIYILVGLFFLLTLLNIIFLSNDWRIAGQFVGVQLIGALFVIFLPIFFQNYRGFKSIYKAFYLSAIFVYLLNIYALWWWLKSGKVLAGTPFWRSYSASAHTVSYIQKVSYFQGFPRFRFPFASPGGTGVFLAIAGIFLFNEIFKAKSNRKLYTLLLAVNTFFLIGTFTRTAWIIFLIGILVSLHYLHKYKLTRIKRVFGLFFTIGFILALFLVSIPRLEQVFLERFSLEATYTSNIGHLQTRLLGWEKFSESPLMGIGIGNLFVQGYGPHTHSVYFTFLAERGLFIFLIYLSFLLLLLYLLKYRMNLLSKSPQTVPLTYNISLFSSLFSMIFFGHFLGQNDIEFMWLFYGMIAVFINLDFDRKKKPPLTSTKDRVKRQEKN